MWTAFYTFVELLLPVSDVVASASLLLQCYVTMQAAQQTEVYWMALARDIPFSQFPSNDLIRLAAGTLHMGR